MAEMDRKRRTAILWAYDKALVNCGFSEVEEDGGRLPKPNEIAPVVAETRRLMPNITPEEIGEALRWEANRARDAIDHAYFEVLVGKEMEKMCVEAGSDPATTPITIEVAHEAQRRVLDRMSWKP